MRTDFEMLIKQDNDLDNNSIKGFTNLLWVIPRVNTISKLLENISQSACLCI